MRLLRRTGRRRGSPVSILLYERPGCHLCDDAEQLLLRLGRRYPLTLQKIDITTDPDLVRRFDVRIPVIVVAGALELDAPIDARSLEQALKTAN